MKQNDAMKVLNIDSLNGELNADIIKKAYRLACSKYHPDRNPAGLEMMKAVNLAYEVLKDFSGSLESGVSGYDEILNEVLKKVVEMQGVEIEVCGAWIWLTGDTKKFKEILKELGFFWANKKKAWYFRPDDWVSASRGTMTLDEIRDSYGSQRIVNKAKPVLTKAA